MAGTHLPPFLNVYSEAWWDREVHVQDRLYLCLQLHFIYSANSIFVSARKAMGWVICFIAHVAKMIMLVFPRYVSRDPGWDGRAGAVLDNFTFWLSHF